jgi:hypothetical protein
MHCDLDERDAERVGERSVISQPEAVLYIQVPILEMTVASHKTVKGA